MFELLRELKERLSALESYKPVRIGEVVAVYPQRATARVKFLDMDEETSYELQILHPHTYKDKAYWMPRIGEKVVCLMLNLTDGFIVGGFYHNDCPPPTESGDKAVITFEDGTWIEHDKRNHKITVDCKGNVEITVNNGNGTFTINGNLYVSQNITAGKEIADLNGERGTLSTLRDTYDVHTHNGSPPPDQTI